FDTEFCVKNGITPARDIGFDDYVVETATAWAAYIDAWQQSRPEADILHYEALLSSPETALAAVFQRLGEDVNPADIEVAVQAHTKQKMAASLDSAFAHNTFVRKGMAGNW